jgi:hypothetical protein
MTNTIRALGPILALPLAAACVPSSAPVTGDRAAAEQVALQIVAARDPVIDPAPVAACIARGADRDEAATIAAAGREGNREAALGTIEFVLRKSGTQDCLAAAGSPDFFL